ncbi:MAG: hypothetical protein ACTSQP_24010, partial [Promethearchaeota archaeon]
IDADQTAINKFTELYKSLDWWLNLMGLMANYRGTLNINLPICLPKPGMRETEIELKEIDRIVKETYPGENNSQGAIFSVETVRYIVDDVRGTSISLVDHPIVACTNVECLAAFLPYNGNSNECIFCEKQLKEFIIYNYSKIKAKPARKLGDNFETFPYIISYPEIIEVIKEYPSIFFNLKALIKFGKVKVVKSTVAFSRKYNVSKEPKIQLSQAYIEKDITNDQDFDPFKIDDDIDIELGKSLQEIEPEYNPVGFKFQTFGLEIKLSTNHLEKIINMYIDDVIQLKTENFIRWKYIFLFN